MNRSFVGFVGDLLDPGLTLHGHGVTLFQHSQVEYKQLVDAFPIGKGRFAILDSLEGCFFS